MSFCAGCIFAEAVKMLHFLQLQETKPVNEKIRPK